jgi:hypothetical protein
MANAFYTRDQVAKQLMAAFDALKLELTATFDVCMGFFLGGGLLGARSRGLLIRPCHAIVLHGRQRWLSSAPSRRQPWSSLCALLGPVIRSWFVATHGVVAKGRRDALLHL